MATITLDQLIAKYQGKFIDYDKVYGPQCQDLIKQYLKDCFGLSPGTIGDAKYSPSNAWMLKYFDRIPVKEARRGDLIFYTGGPHGHSMIGLGSWGQGKGIFEQNRGNPLSCQVRKWPGYSQSTCVAMRRKGTTPPPAPAPPAPTYYTIKKNDNLTKIAKTYKTTVKQLVVWNDIKNVNLIYPGQKLRVK